MAWLCGKNFEKVVISVTISSVNLNIFYNQNEKIKPARLQEVLPLQDTQGNF